MTELYILQQFLQESRLHQKGVCHFDAWASSFGEVTTALELARDCEDVDETVLNFAEIAKNAE